MKRNQLTSLLVLPIISVLAFDVVLKPCFAGAPAQRSSNVEDTVTFEGYGLPFDWDSIPKSLASAIDTHPQAKRFRTDWNFSEGSGSGIGAVLYDRKSKTLKYYARNMDSWSVSTSLYTYHGVTDGLIRKLRADMENPSKLRELPKTNIYFDALLKYGVRRTGGERHRSW